MQLEDNQTITFTNGFLKDDQDCTNPMHKCNLKCLKQLIKNAHEQVIQKQIHGRINGRNISELNVFLTF